MKPLQILSNCLGMTIKSSINHISGNKVRSLNIGKGVTIKLKGHIVSGFENKNQAGVLIHVKGHLHLVVMYSHTRRALSNWIVDCSLLGKEPEGMVGIIDGVQTLRASSDIISLGVVKSWYTNIDDHKGVKDWRGLKLP